MDNIMAYKSLLTYKELESVLRELSDVPYSIIKGEPLSIAAYNEFGKRVSSDVDILVSRKNLSIVGKKLLDYGFKKQHSGNKVDQRINRALMLSASHQTTPLYMQKGVFKLMIDLNFDIFWGEYMGKRIDIDAFLCDTIDMNVYGVDVKTLPPLKAMVQLVLHNYKDMNSIFLLATRKSIKHSMFNDVYHLLKNNIDDITIEKLYAISSEYEIIPYVYYILYYTGRVFENELLNDYIAAFKTERGDLLLNCYGLSESERREWNCDFNDRLQAENLYVLIKDDLTEKDIEKISINGKAFLGD